MLYAGSRLDKAREVFAAAIEHRLRIRLTIRQRADAGAVARARLQRFDSRLLVYGLGLV